MNELPDLVIPGYDLRELLGKGGFGEVYRAYQQHVQREVALKIILPQYANQPDFIRRFEAEAQLVARLEHPYIVPLYDFWRTPHGAFLAMRFLRGGSLEQLLEKGPLDLEVAARLLEQIGSALTTAHRNGVIHQDLKPANILLDNEQNAYLTDFGIAKEVSKNKVGEVDDQPRQGTLHYISPEQLSYTPVSFRSDIYSLGIMLYEMLTGKPPFDGKTLDDMVYKHLYENVPSVQFERPELPEGLNDVIAQATAKNPRARYADAVTMAVEFRQVVNDFNQKSRQPVPAPIEKPTDGAPTKELSIADIPMDPVNPYKGLRPFQEADSSDFYGREAFIEKLLKRLQEPGAFSSFLAVVGPSGSGKSSVVKAGLVPALRKGALHGSESWFYVEMTPKAHPMAELEQALLKVSTKEDVSFTETLNAPDGYGLFHALDQALPDEKTELVLVIDQFEELYTLTEDAAEREQFLKVLVKAAGEALSRVWIIITLRADFVDRPLQHQEFGNLITERIEFVLPMSAKELEQSIVGPANRVGLKIEGSLVAVIVADVNKQPGALPLLQYALTELYNNRRGITLTLDAYRTMGGISGALARRADELYVQMKNESKQAARQLFLRMITINEGAEATRRRAMQSELTSVADEAEKARIQQIMNTFAKYRLLTFDNDPTTRAPTVEIAHEALVREWDQFRAWIRDSREQLQAQRRLSTSTDDWNKANRDSSFLASGARLEEFERLANEKSLILNEQENEYVRASMALRQRGSRIRQGIIAALSVLTVAAIIGFVVASIRTVDATNAAATANAASILANREATISRSQTLALTSITGISTGNTPFDLSLLLAVQAWETYPTFDAHNALLSALLARPNLTAFLNSHTEPVGTVAFSPNPEQPIVASGSLDETIILWDANTRQPIGEPLTGHEQRVNSVAFSPDGSLLASGSSDTQVMIWDLSGGTENITPRTLSGHTQAVWAVAFSPDGQMVASAGQDGTIILWQVSTGEILTRLEGHTGDIYTLAFSPDGTQIASAGDDLEVRLWDISDLENVTNTVVLQAEGAIYSVAFSPDGSILLAASGDQRVHRWNVTTRQAQNSFGPFNQEMRSVTFVPGSSVFIAGDASGNIRLINYLLDQSAGLLRSPSLFSVTSLTVAPDGCSLVSSSLGDTSVALWNICDSQPLASPLEGHTQPVLDVAVSANSNRIASISGSLSDSSSGELRLWDTATGEPQQLLTGYDDLIISIAFSPDGQWLAAGGAFNGEVLIWNTETGAQVVQYPTQQSILALAFSPDTTRTLLATAGASNVISLWTLDGTTLTPTGTPFAGHTERINALAFSPDGTKLVSGSDDNTVRLWDVATGQQIGEPLSEHDQPVTGVAFNNDGTLVASSSRDGTVRLWNVATRQVIGQPLNPQSGRIRDVAFSADGTMLAIATEGRFVILWDVATRRMLGVPLSAHRDQVNTLAFSSDGQTLVSGASDRLILLWDVSVRAWENRACQIANRSLTAGEWQQYLENQPYEPACPLAQ